GEERAGGCWEVGWRGRWARRGPHRSGARAPGSAMAPPNRVNTRRQRSNKESRKSERKKRRRTKSSSPGEPGERRKDRTSLHRAHGAVGFGKVSGHSRARRPRLLLRR